MGGKVGSESGREAMRQAALDAQLGITGVDYAIAETGSVVLLPSAHLSRLTSLLPPVHLAIVRPREVLGTLDDLFLLRRLAFYDAGEDGSLHQLHHRTQPHRRYRAADCHRRPWAP